MIRLLFKHLSISQLTGFFLANLIGMFIVLSGLQAYRDIQPMFSGGDSFMKPEYMILTKKVTIANTLANSHPSFSKEELDHLREQEFTDRVADFVCSGFEVEATVGGKIMGGMGISTEMFFEAIPDEYIDVDLEEWHWKEGGTLPVILPRNYLNLYNFGFAPSKGLPTLSEGLISSIKIGFSLTGNGTPMQLSGKVIGFSDKLNTILVPISFMKEANRHFNCEADPRPSRIVLSVKNPTDERIAEYISRHNYQTENSSENISKMKYFLNLLVWTVICIGFIISALALYVLLLSIYLLLQKLTDKIDNLLLLGYTLRSVTRPYVLLGAVLNLICLLVAIAGASALRKLYLPLLEGLMPTYEAPSSFTVYALGAVLLAIVVTINSFAVSRKIKGIWDIHKKA